MCLISKTKTLVLTLYEEGWGGSGMAQKYRGSGIDMGAPDTAGPVVVADTIPQLSSCLPKSGILIILLSPDPDLTS